MIQCDICKKPFPSAEKKVISYEIIKKATDRGYIPSHYGETTGVQLGVPKTRKWHNIVASFPNDNMELCTNCNAEVMEVYNQKNSKFYYCFIATAVYETPFAPEVMVLRTYRDKVLLTNFFGRMFVKTYYFLSPGIADLISNSNTTKTFLRNYIFNPIVKSILFKYNFQITKK